MEQSKIESLIAELLSAQPVFDRDGCAIGYRPPTANEKAAARMLRELSNEVQAQNEH